MNFQNLNAEISKAQAEYQSKASELENAQRIKDDAYIALIRAEGIVKGLRLQTTVLRSQVESLIAQGRNLRRESQI